MRGEPKLIILLEEGMGCGASVEQQNTTGPRESKLQNSHHKGSARNSVEAKETKNINSSSVQNSKVKSTPKNAMKTSNLRNSRTGTGNSDDKTKSE